MFSFSPRPPLHVPDHAQYASMETLEGTQRSFTCQVCLLGFYVATTSKVIWVEAPTCDSAHSL